MMANAKKRSYSLELGLGSDPGADVRYVGVNVLRSLRLEPQAMRGGRDVEVSRSTYSLGSTLVV